MKHRASIHPLRARPVRSTHTPTSLRRLGPASWLAASLLAAACDGDDPAPVAIQPSVSITPRAAGDVPTTEVSTYVGPFGASQCYASQAVVPFDEEESHLSGVRRTNTANASFEIDNIHLLLLDADVPEDLIDPAEFYNPCDSRLAFRVEIYAVASHVDEPFPASPTATGTLLRTIEVPAQPAAARNIGGLSPRVVEVEPALVLAPGESVIIAVEHRKAPAADAFVCLSTCTDIPNQPEEYQFSGAASEPYAWYDLYPYGFGNLSLILEDVDPAPAAYVLDATRSYTAPVGFFDDAVALGSTQAVKVPTTLSVREGNAGNHTATLELFGNQTLECCYRGGASVAHVGSNTTQIVAGQRYQLRSCSTTKSLTPAGCSSGEILPGPGGAPVVFQAHDASLRVNIGDNQHPAGKTRAQARLELQ